MERLEDCFRKPSAMHRLRSCLFGGHLDKLCALLSNRGYRSRTIRNKVVVVARFSRWMVGKQLSVEGVNERCVEDFVDLQQRRRGRAQDGIRSTLLLLLEHLRSEGIVPAADTACDNSPGAVILARYKEYLRCERGLAAGTIAGSMTIARSFVAERFEGTAVAPTLLRAGDVCDFLLPRVRRMTPRNAQWMSGVLRCFLRFLFLRGETSCNLALTVPRMRRQRLVNVPRHISPEDVEKLLDACIRSSSATRHRDYAILLLLARLGLRAGEVVALQLDDFRWREGEIIVRGKAHVHDRLPLPVDVGEAIALYLKTERPPGRSRHVFIRSKAPRCSFSSSAAISTLVARALKRAGLAPGTHGAHLLRHSLATAMVRRGASLAEIGQVLRHRSPHSTESYARLDFGALRGVALPWPATGGAR